METCFYVEKEVKQGNDKHDTKLINLDKKKKKEGILPFSNWLTPVTPEFLVVALFFAKPHFIIGGILGPETHFMQGIVEGQCLRDHSYIT